MFVHVTVANVRKQSDWIVQSYGAEGIKSTMPGFRSYFWDCVLGPLTLIWVWFGAGSGTIQSQIHQLVLFALHQDQASFLLIYFSFKWTLTARYLKMFTTSWLSKKAWSNLKGGIKNYFNLRLNVTDFSRCCSKLLCNAPFICLWFQLLLWAVTWWRWWWIFSSRILKAIRLVTFFIIRWEVRG